MLTIDKYLHYSCTNCCRVHALINHQQVLAVVLQVVVKTIVVFQVLLVRTIVILQAVVRTIVILQGGEIYRSPYAPQLPYFETGSFQGQPQVRDLLMRIEQS